MSGFTAKSCLSDSSHHSQNRRLPNLTSDTNKLKEQQKELNMDSIGLPEGVTDDDRTSGGDFLHDYAKKFANYFIDGEEPQLESFNDPCTSEESNTTFRRAAANDDETIVAASLHDYAKKYSNTIAGREYVSEEGNYNTDTLDKVKNESNNATVTIYNETDGAVTQHDYAKKVIDDLENIFDPDMLRETRKETIQESNEITNYAGGCASGHDYAKKMIVGHDYLESSLHPNPLKETRKELNHRSNETVTNYASGCVSVHDYAKKLVYEHESMIESIVDCDMLGELEKENNEPSKCVTNKDDSRASLHDYAKKIDVIENLLSTEMREIREYNQYSSSLYKGVIGNVEICDEVHNYAKKVTNGLEGTKKNSNLGLNCLGNTSNHDGGSGSMHNYAKKFDENFKSLPDNVLDTDKTEEIGKEFYKDSNELCKSVSNDYRNCEVASLHDYAKPMKKVIAGHKTNYDLHMSEGTSEDLLNESIKLRKSVVNDDDTICGVRSLHDYAKKIIVGHEILSESISDKNRLGIRIIEVNKELNEVGKPLESDNRFCGEASVHDYAKKITNVNNDHESLPNNVCGVEMLQGMSDEADEEFNRPCKSVGNEVHKESKDLFKLVADDDGICSGASVHDYAKKVTNTCGDNERMSEAICDVKMLEGKITEVDKESNKLCKSVANDDVICNGASVNYYAKQIKYLIGDPGSVPETNCDKEILKEKINESCKSVENEIHKEFKELDKSVPSNDINFIVEHESLPDNVCDIEMLEGKSHKVDKESNELLKPVENEVHEELKEPDKSVLNDDEVCGGASVNHYVKKITDVIIDHESMSETGCQKEMIEEDNNEMLKELNELGKFVGNKVDGEFYELDKPLTNDDEICRGALLQVYEKEIINVVHDSFPDNVCDIEMLEGKSNEVYKESIEPAKLVAIEVDVDSNGTHLSVPNDETVKQVCVEGDDENVIDDKESIVDQGWESIRTLACLFCNDMFESASALYKHDSKYHWALKERLKIEDSEVRCKQCDEMVIYSKMHDHMASHLPAENKCQFCNLLFRSLKRLEKHVNSHINSENFCSYCGMQFTNNRNKMIHMTKVHKEINEFLCDDCGLQFQSLQLLEIHLKNIHHKTAEYYCSYSGKEFCNVANKLKHMKLHSTADPREILCEVCGLLFLDYRSLASHQRLHADQGDFVCKTCTKSFQTQAELDAHISTHLKSYSCKVCSKRFHQKYLVRQHMLSHSDIKPYSCFCGASFNRAGNFRRHTNLHKSISSNQSDDKQNSSNNFVCGICKRDLKTKLKLRWHEAKHAGEKKPFDCDLCGCRFAKLNYYKVHMMKHTGERPYTCSVCQQGFRTQNTLQQHTKDVHMNIYPYKCDDCGQLFKQRIHFSNHKVTHTGEKPYACYICGRQYTQNASLSRHLKSHTDCFFPITAPFSEPDFIEMESVLTAPFSFTTANEPALIRFG